MRYLFKSLDYITKVFFLSLIIQTANAEELPLNYPNNFTWFGQVEIINSSRSNFILSDHQFTYNTSTSVVLLDKSNSALHDLRVGMNVGVIAEDSHALSVWELPDSFAGKSGSDIDDD